MTFSLMIDELIECCWEILAMRDMLDHGRVPLGIDSPLDRIERIVKEIKQEVSEPKLSIRQSHIYMRFYIRCTECGYTSEPLTGPKCDEAFEEHKRKHENDTKRKSKD